MLTAWLVALAVAATPAQAATGDLTQKPGQAGCVIQVTLFGEPIPDPLCADGRSLDNTTDVAVSPGGENVYVASQAPGGVAIFDRSLTGAVTQKPALEGCVSENGGGGAIGAVVCQDGKALAFANSVVVSPDGKNVYVSSYFGVAVFDRDATGALRQKAGAAGCISETGRSDRDDPATAGGCVDGTALSYPTSVIVSPDGKNVYTASQESDAVAILDRNTTTGALTQKAGTAGCVSETGQSNPDDPATAGQCQNGVALDGVFSLTVSGDGKNVYAVGEPANAVAIFDRAATGALAQKAGTAGCISENGTGGACADGKALNLANEDPTSFPRAVAVSPDGKSVYVVSSASDAVAVFDRAATGSLTQKSGTAGCVSDDGTGGACANGNALDRASGVVVSPDGLSVYVTSFAHTSNTIGDSLNGSAVVIFDRDLATGALNQRPSPAGCIQNNDVGTPGACTEARRIAGAFSPTVSPDGKNVYVASYSNRTLTIFDRQLPPDTDNDGLIDAVDRCPTQPGPASNGGCPVSVAVTPTSRYPVPISVTPAAPFADCPSSTALVIRGTAASNSIVGTRFADRIFAGTGDDTVDGLASDDCIDLGPGTDRGQGGDGDDLIVGGLGRDLLAGNLGNDRLRGGSSADRLIGGFGNDILHGQSGSDRVNGERGRDRINGGSSNDVISGGSSADRIAGDQGADRITGNSGNDSIKGNSGRDRLKGSSGRDRISGGSGKDKISARDDQRDRINCGSGRDRVTADAIDVVSGNCEVVRRRR